jgi:hypothetical protein
MHAILVCNTTSWRITNNIIIDLVLAPNATLEYSPGSTLSSVVLRSKPVLV